MSNSLINPVQTPPQRRPTHRAISGESPQGLFSGGGSGGGGCTQYKKVHGDGEGWYELYLQANEDKSNKENETG